jgi:hypothetical protein
MTRGNPRPGKQEMPDRSDDTERQARKARGAVTREEEERHATAKQLREEARDAATESTSMAGKRRAAPEGSDDENDE